jgi:hypothetical protein
MSGITSLKDIPRGNMGTAEVVDILIADESDFTAATTDFPVRADIAVGGEITAAIPFLAATATLGLPVLKFAIQKGKSAAKKDLGAGPGYESYLHDGLEGEFVGVSKDQWLTLDKFNNKAVVAFVRYPDGKRRVFGSLRVPLQAMFEEFSGVDGATVKASFKSTGKHNFFPPHLAVGVALPVLP